MPSKADMLQKMAAQVRTGGKGSVRRKRKVVHHNSEANDQRLQQSLHNLGMNQIGAIEEANLFHEDGTVTHFTNPRVMASVEANIVSISGKPEKKQLQELFPGIINQLGIENLSRVAEQLASARKEEEKKAEEPEKKEEEAAAPAAAEEEAVDETGLSAQDIDLVVQQGKCTRAKAVEALRRNNGDIVNSIMELSA